jgi:hypothetical protein
LNLKSKLFRNKSIETPEFVFQQTGHLRDFHGRAYLPQSLPQGVNASAIR